MPRRNRASCHSGKAAVRRQFWWAPFGGQTWEILASAEGSTGTCARRIQKAPDHGIGLSGSPCDSDSAARSIPRESPQKERAEPRFFHRESNRRRNGAKIRLAF